ncbi:hypothetical protein V1264_005520 [Littorina saxatilis]|uniref:ABC transmembrane type-1 domain-containing protein n=1 Tax=Littorina saxatilis TaxID=31220 RepID=A0AAN9G602_9CAEN
MNIDDENPFCDSPFWNSSLSWYGTTPDVTSCFQDTALIYLPCLVLWLMATIHVYCVIRRRAPARSILSSRLFKSKLVLNAILFILTLVMIGLRISRHVYDAESVFKSDVTASVVLLVTMCLAAFIIVLEHKRACVTSGVLFLFWLLLTTAWTVRFYSSILNEVYSLQPGVFTVLTFQYGLICSLFLLNCFAEKIYYSSDTPSSKPRCAEPEASVLSGLTFWWMNRLMREGYRSPLTEVTVHDLHPDQKASSNVLRFLQNWSRTHRQNRTKSTTSIKRRRRRKHRTHIKMHTYTPLNTSDSNHDTHPLLDNNTLFSDDDSSDELSEETSMTIRKENDNSSLHKNGNALTNRTLLNAKTSSMKKTDKVDDGFTNRTLLNDETVPVKTDDSNGWTNRTVLGEETSSMKTDDKNNDRLTNRTLLNDKTVSAKTDDSNGRTNRTLLDDETVSAKTDDSNGRTNRTVLRDETSSMKSDDERDGGRKENKKERVKNAEVSLLKVLWKTFGVEAVAIQVWELCLLFLLLSNPLLVGLLIEFIEDSQAPPWRGYLHCALLFLSTVIRSVLDKQVYHLSGCLGLRVRTCVTSAVYRKALRLDVSSRQDSTAGEMVNLMSVDAQHLEEMTTSLYLLWSGPVELVVCLVLLYVILGPSLLAGLAIVFVMIPANILILRELRKCGTKFMELKDSRLKILNEVLNGIKVIVTCTRFTASVFSA